LGTVVTAGGPATTRRVDDEGLPPESPPRRVADLLVRTMHFGEDIVFAVLAVVLFALAVIVLGRTVHDVLFPPPPEVFVETITRALNGVLFVLIVMEVLRTLIARFQGEGFRLQPFLVIAIISAVRHILTVGARLSLVGEQADLRRDMVELGVNAAVVVALSIALVLIRRFARLED
jgi:uncharacterized membrane protein (DUF373 family)